LEKKKIQQASQKLKKNNTKLVMWIIKIGGSWITSHQLNDLLQLLKKKAKSENIVLVVGGGCFADSVRLVYKKKKMSERTSSFVALKSTELFAHLLKEIDKDIDLTEDFKSLNNKGNLKVWLPSNILKTESSFISSWESTSDSVAAWLHNKMDSKGLLFIKSLKLKRKSYNLKYLQKEKIIDRNVGKYILRKNNIKIIGPEIIDYLKKSSQWNKIFLKMNEIEF
tara:strand:- start:94 stop:765 length:672 start_codon:yes stop_codon:yes gene_type:complete